MNNITTIDETTALILAGDGYQLTIAPEAEERKAVLLTAAASITTVTSNDESADAQVQSRRLAQMRIEVEKSRKAVKEPVNRIGKLIDATAKNFLDSLEAEERRITRLVGDHAAEVARLKRIKEEEERRAFEEARAAREAAERAAEAAETTGKVSDIVTAKLAERERQEALAARMEASAEVATTKVAEGVRFAWDFEVESIEVLYAMDRTLVDVTPRRAAILAKIRDAESFNMDIERTFASIGIRAFKKPVVSSR
jgi:hypothetical protein